MEIFTFASIFVMIVSYLLGSINTSIIVSKKTAGIDIRKQGSGNAGATNTLRTLGTKAGIIVLLGDFLKAVVAMGIAIIVAKITKADDEVLLKQFAGIFVVLGHILPIFYGFKGGKGVATSLGVILCINHQIGLICLVFALIIMAVTRIVSLGSVLAAVLFPVLIAFLDSKYILSAIALALIVIIKHRKNIQRLLKGEENKLGSKK